ncbi:hypothetical protein [Streptomyces sp. NPDC127084]
MNETTTDLNALELLPQEQEELSAWAGDCTVCTIASWEGEWTPPSFDE